MEDSAEQIQNIYQVVTEFLVNYSFQIIGALFIFLLGVWFAGKTSRVVGKLLKKKAIDETLTIYVSKLTKVIIIAMVLIICLGKLGISITPFVAAVGAVSLGAGLALQGMLTNYAAGVTIIITRPFQVGDTVELAGVQGQVKEIQLGLTVLTNEQGEQITIPNKHIIGEIIHNSFEYMAVETVIGVAYDSDLDKVIETIRKVLNKHALITNDPTPIVGVDSFGDSAINMGIRFWVETQSYHKDRYQINLEIYQALVSDGVNIPFPQREVLLKQN